MTPCPSEAVLAVHADGELPPAEARSTDAHVAGCPRCRVLLDELRGEDRLLSRVLEEGVPVPAPRAVWAGLGATAMALVAAASGLHVLFGLLGEVGRESPVDLDARSLVVSVLFETLFYLLREGASMLTPLVSTLGLVVLAVLAAVVALSLRRRSAAGALLLLLVLLGLASPAPALERRVARKGEGHVVVAAGETVDDSLFAAGESVSIDGVVTGDLIAFAERVSVRGTVKGDLFTAAQRVDLVGGVEGNAIAISQTTVVRGPVTRSLHAFAEHVTLDRDGRVEGDVVTFAAGLDVEGRVGRDLLAHGGFANLRGEVARHASTWTDRLRVDGGARIGGDLTAHAKSEERVVVDARARVGGRSETRIEAGRKGSRYARPGFYLWRTIWLVAAFLAGLLLHRLAPSLFGARLAALLPVAKAFGVGFVALVAAPVAMALAALTIVGLPLALLALAVWGSGLYLSSVFAGAALGRTLLSVRQPTAVSFAPALFVGLAVVTVAVNLPYVGGLLRVLVITVGLGIGVIHAGRTLKVLQAA
jgi:anti-sigma factor RsiW/cytoskeletal protein CcmA (bactofilin family)